MKFKVITLKSVLIEQDVPDSDVPCTTIGCTECCEKLSPYLTEEEFASGNYIYTLTSTADPAMPAVSIPRTQHGCIYLSPEKKCTIYDIRPRACRQFDCRQNHSPVINNKFLEN